MFVTPVQLVKAVGQRNVAVARRNALAASAALAERRRERDEVERFLAARGTVMPLPAPVPGVDPARGPSASQGA